MKTTTQTLSSLQCSSLETILRTVNLFLSHKTRGKGVSNMINGMEASKAIFSPEVLGGAHRRLQNNRTNRRTLGITCIPTQKWVCLEWWRYSIGVLWWIREEVPFEWQHQIYWMSLSIMREQSLQQDPTRATPRKPQCNFLPLRVLVGTWRC